MVSILKGLMSTEANTEKFRQHKLISLLKQKCSIPLMDQIIALSEETTDRPCQGSSVVDVTSQTCDDEQTTITGMDCILSCKGQ